MADLHPHSTSQQMDIDPSLPPLLYHTHHREYIEDIPFWIDLARKYGSPVLELGCGTGRVLLPLLESGYPCVGVDNNQNMLDFLQGQIDPEIFDRVTLSQADFLSLNLGRQFPLIILPCNTYSTLGDTSRRSALDRIYRHLSINGVFATSIMNPALLVEIEPSESSEIETYFAHPVTENPVQISYQIVRAEDKVSINWFYDHLYPNGKADRFLASASHYIVPTSQFLSEFHAAKFSLEQIYGDFDLSPSAIDSPYLILLARKI